ISTLEASIDNAVRNSAIPIVNNATGEIDAVIKNVNPMSIGVQNTYFDVLAKIENVINNVKSINAIYNSQATDYAWITFGFKFAI
ncbi:hypothetical protein PFISCL1PPCAC_4872, partial [Pristionchus fissidentatus]